MKNREYRGEFSGWPQVLENYGNPCPPKEPRFVFGQYETPSYEGYSTVIVSDDGVKFKVVEGSHCSCFGLEGQWEPTEHSIPEIEKMMLEAKSGFYAIASDDIRGWLKRASR